MTGDELEVARATNDPAAETGVTEKAVGQLNGLAIFRACNDPWRHAEYVIRPACQKLLAYKGENSIFLNRLIAAISQAPSDIERIESCLS